MRCIIIMWPKIRTTDEGCGCKRHPFVLFWGKVTKNTEPSPVLSNSSIYILHEVTHMRDIYEYFISCCMQRCYSFEELVDKKIRRRHNVAMDRIAMIEKEIYAQPDHGSSIIENLLDSEDERVRLSAGAYCIKAQILMEKSTETLKYIAESSKSRYMRVSAMGAMAYCKPWEGLTGGQGDGSVVPTPEDEN